MPRFKQIGIDLDVNRAIEARRRSFAETPNDILRRMVLAGAGNAVPGQTSSRAGDREGPATPGNPRIRGLWTVELRGQRKSAANLKEAYRTLLLWLHAEFPEFLKGFSEARGKSRRFIARIPTLLYLNSPHLAKNHAQALTEGWFFDTNLSTEQVGGRARIAARLCGLRYGADVRILDNLREI